MIRQIVASCFIFLTAGTCTVAQAEKTSQVKATTTMLSPAGLRIAAGTFPTIRTLPSVFELYWR